MCVLYIDNINAKKNDDEKIELNTKMIQIYNI